MAEIYKFFNSTATDKRLYQAEDFAEFFAEFLSSGLVHRDGKPFISVRLGEDPKTQTVVSSGTAIIRGHLYKNTSDITLTHYKRNLPKIDRIVLRLDNREENRFIKVFIKEGEPSSNPIAPQLQRDSDVYELSLAQVRVPDIVTDADLTIIDERYNDDLCGIVDSLISIPVADLQQDFNKFKNDLNTEFYKWFDDAIRQSSVELLENELKIIKQNQIELLIQRYLEGKSTDMDAGYFYDVLKDWSKLNRNETTALLDINEMALKFPSGESHVKAVWNPHEVGFTTNKVRHYQTRPIQNVLTLAEDALAGQNVIKVENAQLIITEVDETEVDEDE